MPKEVMSATVSLNLQGHPLLQLSYPLQQGLVSWSSVVSQDHLSHYPKTH